MKWYTTRDAANLLGISPRRVRAFARSGILQPERGPRRQYRLSFQDLVLLRTAVGLRAARISPRKVNAALDRLRRQLPLGRSLSELRIVAENDRILVHDDDGSWNPFSGQYHFDFSVRELGAKVATLATRRDGGGEAPSRGLDARGWFELGAELEAYAPVEARRAYERALEMDPDLAEARVNLGRLLHQAGDPAAAEVHYRAALALGPHATAAYDLGLVLEDLQRPQDAIAAYRRAIEIDPGLADAHYNLARLLEATGDPQGALRHLAHCKRIVDGKRPG